VRKNYQDEERSTRVSPTVPEAVSVALAEPASEVCEELLALVVGAGLQFLPSSAAGGCLSAHAHR
jgi:hypothetical protein